MNLPTKITVSRIVLIVGMLIAIFVMALIPNWTALELGNSGINIVYLIICVVFLVASFTDFLDGYLARKNNQVTDLGKFLDPIADKMLVNSILIFLLIPQHYAPHQLPNSQLGQTFLMFCVIVMVIRDLIVDALRFLAAQKKIVIAANKFGKAKTVLQMVAIPFLLLNDWPFRLIYGSNCPEACSVSFILLYLATAVSVLSGVIYVYQNRKVFSSKPQEEK